MHARVWIDTLIRQAVEWGNTAKARPASDRRTRLTADAARGFA